MTARDSQGFVSRPTGNTIEVNNELFGKRLREFNCSEEGKELRKQLVAIRKRFFGVYRQAALDHWKENGTDASTGWGCVPEGKYQHPERVPVCARRLADKLVDVVLTDPNWKGNGW